MADTEEPPQSNEDNTRETHDRPAVRPLLVVIALLFAGLVIFGLTRIYLELNESDIGGLTMAAPAAVGVSLFILLAAWYVAGKRPLPRWQTASIGVVAVALVTGGAIWAAVQDDGGAEQVTGPTDVPATETPATDAPTIETPAAGTPATETPATETPTGDAPATDTPAADTPAADTPTPGAPATEAPAVATPTAETPATVAVRVDLLDNPAFAAVVEPSSAPADTVTFTVINQGILPHNLRIIRTDLGLGSLPLDDQGFGVDEGAVNVVSSVPDLLTGESLEFSISLQAGNYVLICNIAGHYAAGMRTSFTVQ